MKKVLYFVFFMSSLFVLSCKKNITDLNNNPTRPGNVPSANLFSNATVNLGDLLASTNVNYNNFRLYVQYWTETIYRDETRFNLNSRSIADRWWATLYRDIIKDLTEASKKADEESLTLSAAEIKNRKAMNEILIVLSYYHLLTSFGDIPYEQALDIENLQPSYDDASQVFGKIATRLDDAIAALDLSAGGYGSADFILGGDAAGWKRLGNSLKLRMGMLIADVDPATAQSMVLAAAPNVVLSNSENIKMNFLSSPPNTNPVWEDLIQSGRHDFVAANTLMDTLKAYDDARIPLYFNAPVTAGLDYIGQRPGTSVAVFNDFSAPSDYLSRPDHPHIFFSFSEMEFLKAEAIERGIAVGGAAEEHYNNAIDASFEEWGATAAAALAYRSQPSVMYATAAGTYKQKIGLQSWLALYNKGYEAWTQWRRLDYPNLPLPNLGATNNFADGETPAVITRLSYPVVEQNLNKANYEAASAAIGHDWKTQKLWFDTF